MLGGGNLSYCPLRLCTFSRVSKEKGIEDAVAVVTALNRRLGFTAYTLDIYGQVDTAYEARFAALQQTFPPEVRYCGCVPAAESVGIISKYFALLFPTYYPGEGFAGTLIDAFSAGVPVIASDWKYNGEIVHKGVGFLFRTHHLNELDHILTTLVAHPIQALTLKPACLREAARYSASAAIEQIAHLISG